MNADRLHNLQEIMENASSENLPSVCELIFADRLVDLNLLTNVFKEEIVPSNLIFSTTKIIAELAKTEIGRKELISLLDCLPSNFSRNSDTQLDVQTQTFRAICNLCYESPEGCERLLKNGGLVPTIQAIKKVIIPEENSSVDYKLACTAASCLCNLLHANVDGQRWALENGIVDVFLQCLSASQFQDLRINLITCLWIMADSDQENSRMLINSALPFTIIQELLNIKENALESIIDTALDFLVEICPEDSNKLKLVQSGMVSRLLEISLVDDEESTVPQKAANFLVELLAVPDCLDFVFEFNLARSVLDAATKLLFEASIKQQTAGALIIGNIARNLDCCTLIFNAEVGSPAQCLPFAIINQLVKSINKLKSLAGPNIHGDHGQISTNSDSDLDTKHATEILDIFQLRFAILSAIKNLIVPTEIRMMFVKLNYVRYLLSFSVECAYFTERSNDVPVISKLLTILCMLSGTCAEVILEIGEDKLVLRQIILWMSFKNSLVSHESIRLISIILSSTCLSSAVYSSFRQSDFLQSLNNLLKNGSPLQKKDVLNLLKTCEFDSIMSDPDAGFSDLSAALTTCLDSQLSEQELIPALHTIRRLRGYEEFCRSLQSSGILSSVEALLIHSNEGVRNLSAELFQKLCDDPK